MEQQFKKGDYVVLLTGCMGDAEGWEDIPTKHVYRLREDFSSTRFSIENDLSGDKYNGWSLSPQSRDYKKYVDKITVRAATQSEIARCRQAEDYPVPEDTEPIEPNYEVF